MQLAILRRTAFKFPLPQANLVCPSGKWERKVTWMPSTAENSTCPGQPDFTLFELWCQSCFYNITCLYCWASRVVQYWLYISVILQINPQVLLTYLQVPCYCILLLLWDSFQYCDNSMPKLPCSSHFEMLHCLSPSPC